VRNHFKEMGIGYYGNLYLFIGFETEN